MNALAATPAFAQRESVPNQRELPAFVPGSIWVKLDQRQPEAHDATMRIVRSLANAETTKAFWLVPGLHLVRVRVGDEEAVARLVSNLEGVEWTDLESYGGLTQSSSCTQPDDAATDANFGDQYWVEAIGLDKVWTGLEGLTLPNITIAVMDTGVNYNHPDLIASRWNNTAEVSGVTGVDDDSNGIVDDLHGAAFTISDDPCSMSNCSAIGTPYCTDCDRGPGHSGDLDWSSSGCDALGNVEDFTDDPGFHGTACAAIMAATANTSEVRGFTCNLRIMGIRLWPRCDATGSGSYDESSYISGLEYAILQGVKVVSNSTFLRTDRGDGSAMTEAIKALGDYEVLFVTSAGNARVDLDVPVPTPPPALRAYVPQQIDDSDVLIIGATEEDDTIWIETTVLGSNFGDTVVDLMAPGRAIRVFNGSLVGNSPSGTSFAAPMVAAAAALYWSLNPTASVQDVVDAVKSSVRVESHLSTACETSGILDVATLLGY